MEILVMSFLFYGYRVISNICQCAFVMDTFETVMLDLNFKEFRRKWKHLSTVVDWMLCVSCLMSTKYLSCTFDEML